MDDISIISDTAAVRTRAARRLPETRRSHRAEMAAGARAVAPIAVAAAAFGVSFGIMARDAGMGIAAPLVFSLTTFAGSAQFAVASVLQNGGAVATAIVAAVLLNLRYLAVGMSVAPALRGSKARRLAESQLAVDESWAVSQQDGRVDRDRLVGAGLVLFVSWFAGTATGVFGGSALGDPADYGLDAMFPALFLALLVGQVNDARTRAAAIAGALIAFTLTPVLPAGVPIMVAVGAAALALGVPSTRPAPTRGVASGPPGGTAAPARGVASGPPGGAAAPARGVASEGPV